VKFFVCWHGRNGLVRHPRELGATEVEQFLSMLTTQRNVSVSTGIDRGRGGGLTGCNVGVELLLAKLLYGTGMRLNEGLRLRVKDVDFDRRVLMVRDGKGGKDRVVMLPQSLDMALRSQLAHARTVWEHDRQHHQPGVEVPDALAVKHAGLGQRGDWFWVFAARQHACLPPTCG
jgi:integrase